MNNQELKLSILCTVYNHEKYLKYTLDGFVRQKTKYKYEVIIHDDASTDNSRKIINEYVKKYPHIFKTIFQKENKYSKGHDVIKEYLVPLAKAKYVAFCEGDDFWCDLYKIEKQIDYMEKHNDYSMIVHNSFIVDYKNSIINEVCHKHKECDIDKLNSMLEFPHFSSILMKNPWLEEYGKFVKELTSWDRSFAIYALKCGKIHYLPDYMSCYRYVNSSGTSYQARMKQNNLTCEIISAELSHYNQIKAYDLENINIAPHYFRNVIDYSKDKMKMDPNAENIKLYKLAWEKCPYSKYKYIIYKISVPFRKINSFYSRCVMKFFTRRRLKKIGKELYNIE